MRQFKKWDRADLAEMNSWYRLRGEPELTEDALPTVGYIEPSVGAGFLFTTDSGVCLMENFITNPRASSEDRSAAIEGIVSRLLLAAKNLNFKHIVAITQSGSIAARARQHGFVSLGEYELLSKEV